MARIFISGSSTGLGLMTGRLLAERGHDVVLHGRSEARSADAHREFPQALAVVTGDLSTVRGAREVAEQVNQLGRFDAVIHNAGIGYREPRRVETEDGLPEVFATNVLAPYVLTALIERPARLVYLSSGMHHSADANLDDLAWTRRHWSGATAYAEEQAARRAAGLRCGTALARRSGECAGAGLGAHPHGRRRCTGRYGPSAPHPGMACRQRRSVGKNDGGVLSSSAPPRPEPAGARGRSAGSPPRCLRTLFVRPLAFW
jgi:NAD(P)-dependent dehydrogenase (short-subunit alcohol dehydrogenase family)